MKKISYQNLILLLALLLTTSCLLRKNEPVKMRLVGLDGKHNPIITRMPEMNAKILSSPAALEEEKKHIAEEAMKEKKRALLKKNSDMQEGDMPLVAVEADKDELKQEKLADNNHTNSVKEIFTEDKKIAEYDLSEEKKEETQIRSSKKPIFIKNSKGKKTIIAEKDTAETASVVSTKAVSKKGFFVQVGSFSDSGNAESTLSRMQKFHRGFVDVVDGEKTIYRVLLGPYTNKAKANAALRKIKSAGHDAVLVRKR